jgi:hypothetical protein
VRLVLPDGVGAWHALVLLPLSLKNVETTFRSEVERSGDHHHGSAFDDPRESK